MAGSSLKKSIIIKSISCCKYQSPKNRQKPVEMERLRLEPKPNGGSIWYSYTENPFRRGSSLVWSVMAGSSLKNHSYQNQFHCVNINRQKTGKSLLKWSGLGWSLSRTASIGYSYTENPFRRGSSLGWSIMAGSSLKKSIIIK
jgi:hypothetical protein